MEALKNIGDAVRSGWRDLAESWNDLVNRGSSALTRFFPRNTKEAGGGTLTSPRWGMLAGDVIDHKNSVIVQLEMPGVQKQDCRVSVVDGYLRIEGEKRMTYEFTDASYRLMQRAYGGFRRTILLPPEADPDTAHAELRDGVLRVELKKKPGLPSRRRQIEVRQA